MDDGKLRALLTAVECGSFSKAAAQLGYTQSAMTHLVNKLEAEIGCTLLERDSQGIRLTDAGKQLLPYIQNVICACDTLLQEAAEQNVDILMKIYVDTRSVSRTGIFTDSSYIKSELCLVEVEIRKHSYGKSEPYIYILRENSLSEYRDIAENRYFYRAECRAYRLGYLFA